MSEAARARTAAAPDAAAAPREARDARVQAERFSPDTSYTADDTTVLGMEPAARKERQAQNEDREAPECIGVPFEEREAAEPATEKAAVTEPAKEEAAQEAAPLPEKKKKSRKAKAEPQPVEPAQPVAAPAESPVVGQADLTLEQLRPAGDAAVPDAPASSDKPVTAP